MNGKEDIKENPRDESMILSDQDQTSPGKTNLNDETLGQDPQSAKVLEQEPDDFIRGEVDVKEQMDRAEKKMHHEHKGTRI